MCVDGKMVEVSNNSNIRITKILENRKNTDLQLYSNNDNIMTIGSNLDTDFHMKSYAITGGKIDNDSIHIKFNRNNYIEKDSIILRDVVNSI